MNELASHIALAMGVEPNIIHVPARNEVMHAYSAHDKIDHVFGERQKTSLDEGLKRMADWVKQHGARQSKKFDNIEIERNFPKAWLN